ncbi:hypothetical protein GpartN1_g2023.t1 [Galdieria partita]|uniref:Uncharacterized protein n=1 Tax=Galdieria partita TaxID=83374 RepID=A0A9C7PUL9_9RHOD|nr:hypothetical protein GpartN1_g2023.t1 [Galdieria partita]
MTSEQLMSISVIERLPPSKGNKSLVSLSEQKESSKQRLDSNNQQLAHKALVSEIIQSSKVGETQNVAYSTENRSASMNQDFQTDGGTRIPWDTEEPLDTVDSQSIETQELCVLFDLSGCLIREPIGDKPIRIEEVGSIVGVEKHTFSLRDLITLTRSTQIQQRVAAVKAICNIFLSISDGTLTNDEASSVLEQFQSYYGPSALVDLLEIPNYRVFHYLLSIVSSLMYEFETNLSHIEERWNIVGFLEEDLQKLSWSDSRTSSENFNRFENVNSWKRLIIAARLVECFFLSKFLDKLHRFVNLRALRTRAYHILSQLFMSYIMYYCPQEQDLRNKVAFEMGRVLVNNSESCDDIFVAKMMTWCLMILPTWSECLRAVLKLESEKTVYYKIQSLRIVMHSTEENLSQYDVWSYLKAMIKNWKNSDYFIEALPTTQCLLLCIEYCKHKRKNNLLLDNESDVSFEISSLLEFLMQYQNQNDDEAMRFYTLLVAELLVSFFLGLSHSTRCSLQKKMDTLFNSLIDMLKHLESYLDSEIESLGVVFSQDTEKQAILFMALRVICLLERSVCLQFPNFEKFINHAWKTIVNYDNMNKEVFAVSWDIYASRHIYYMVLFLADIHMERLLDRHVLSELRNCLRLVSIAQSLGLLSICKKCYYNVFAPDSLKIAFNSWDDAKHLSSFLESQVENILQRHREFWCWTALSTFFHLETSNSDHKQQLFLLLRFYIFLVKQTDVFESMYAVFFYEIMRQLLSGTASWHLSVEQDLEELIFSLLSYDSYHSCALYLETADLGSSLVDSLIDMANSHLFSNDTIASKMTEVFQTTIFHFLLNPSYREEFRLVLWRKCVKCNVQVCDPVWITGPILHYMKPCTDDLCFIIEALGDISRGLVSGESCFFIYKTICIRVATTVFRKPHYWHLLKIILSYSSLYDIADIITEVFVSDILQDNEEYDQDPGVHSQAEVFELLQNANASEEKIKERLKLAAEHFSSFNQLLQNCPFLYSLYASIADS